MRYTLLLFLKIYLLIVLLMSVRKSSIKLFTRPHETATLILSFLWQWWYKLHFTQPLHMQHNFSKRNRTFVTFLIICFIAYDVGIQNDLYFKMYINLNTVCLLFTVHIFIFLTLYKSRRTTIPSCQKISQI